MSETMSLPNSISAEIVTTGTEILLGEIVDTNAAWIAQQLRDAGVNLYYKTTVGDNEERVREVLELGLSRSDVIIVSGGLGPTVDDITRQAIAKAAGRELELDADALETLKARFARFGVEMTANNRQQAMIPAGATVIPNPVGTAPGFIVETDSGAIIAIPGVPREMKRLMVDTVLPYLARLTGQPSVIRRRILRTIGIGESTLDDRLGELMRGSNPTIGLAAKTAQADVRITARADSEAAAEAMIDELAVKVYELIGDHVYSVTPDETIESVDVRLLCERKATLSILESNTVGQLNRRLQAVEDAAQVVAYACDAREGELPQLVTEALFEPDAGTTEADVIAVARALREVSDTTFGLAIVGSYEAGSGIYDTGAGKTWIALVGDGFEDVKVLGYGSTEEFTVTRIGNQALSMIWQKLH